MWFLCYFFRTAALRFLVLPTKQPTNEVRAFVFIVDGMDGTKEERYSSLHIHWVVFGVSDTLVCADQRVRIYQNRKKFVGGMSTTWHYQQNERTFVIPMTRLNCTPKENKAKPLSHYDSLLYLNIVNVQVIQRQDGKQHPSHIQNVLFGWSLVVVHIVSK